MELILMKTKIKYNVKAEGKVFVTKRLKIGTNYSFHQCTDWRTIYNGTFSSKEKAYAKFEELKEDEANIEISIVELNPEGGFYYTAGRKASSGYYTSKTTEGFEYVKKRIEHYYRN